MVNQSFCLVSTKNFFSKILVFVLLLILSTCLQKSIDPLERETNLTKQEVKDAFFKDTSPVAKQEARSKVKIEDAASPIPRISQIITSPPPPRIGSGKIVSFSVTDQVPLKDALIELGRKADIDIDIDPSISGSIILNAKDRPLSEVIDRIASLGNLSYTYKNNILFFERNTPFLKHYSVDYLIDGSLWEEVITNVSTIIAIPDSASAAVSNSSVTSNKSAGIISVYATTNQQKNVTQYLAEVRKNASAQVLIEAKVMEVTLSDYYSSGIDWSNFFNSNVSDFAFDGDASDITSTTLGTPLSVVLSSSRLNIDVTVKLLEQFGVVKAISSPRIHAINNQPANLDFIDKLVYFKLEKDTTTAASGGTDVSLSESFTSTKEEEEVGVKLAITPSINLKTSEILMKIKPEISIQSDSVEDPATAIIAAEQNLPELKNAVPVIQSRTIETIMKVKSGGILVIGGLMKQNTQNVDTGVPFLSEVPILGNLFKSVTKKNQTVETVIFIKATIVNSHGMVDDYDYKFHENFSSDRKEFFKAQ